MENNTCICCGCIIPEGRHVCLRCEGQNDMQTFRPSLRAHYPEPLDPPKNKYFRIVDDCGWKYHIATDRMDLLAANIVLLVPHVRSAAEITKEEYDDWNNRKRHSSADGLCARPAGVDQDDDRRERRMTLDEAIRHCINEVYLNQMRGCEECAEEHEQLAAWLTELKQRREQPDINRAAILRLCNEIEDYILEIDKLSMNYLICLDCKSIRDRLKAIGKELGDAVAAK